MCVTKFDDICWKKDVQVLVGCKIPYKAIENIIAEPAKTFLGNFNRNAS